MIRISLNIPAGDRLDNLNASPMTHVALFPYLEIAGHKWLKPLVGNDHNHTSTEVRSSTVSRPSFVATRALRFKSRTINSAGLVLAMEYSRGAVLFPAFGGSL